MEHSTSAVNWQPRNIAKRPGEMRRNSLAHLARGADGVLFFQWRASRFGAEKHHSAMLPQGGTDTRIWREVVALGAELAALAGLRGTVVEPDLALLWDWESWWALELEWRPSVDLGYLERVARLVRGVLPGRPDRRLRPPRGRPQPVPRWSWCPSLYLATERAAAEPAPLRRGGRHARRLLLLRHRRRARPGVPRPLPGGAARRARPDRRGMAAAARRRAASRSPGEPGGAVGLAGTSQVLGAADVWTEAVILGRRQAGRLVRRRPGRRRPGRHPARARRRPRLVRLRPHRRRRPRPPCSPPPASRPASPRPSSPSPPLPGPATWRSSAGRGPAAGTPSSSTTALTRRRCSSATAPSRYPAATSGSSPTCPPHPTRSTSPPTPPRHPDTAPPRQPPPPQVPPLTRPPVAFRTARASHAPAAPPGGRPARVAPGRARARNTPLVIKGEAP